MAPDSLDRFRSGHDSLRGLPEILVVLFIYFGSSQLLLMLSDGFTINLGFVQIPLQMQIEDFDVSPFLWRCHCAVAAVCGIQASQTLRGALKAVPSGQWESGQALGLSKTAIFFRLVMPQMWRHALPGLGNQWLVLLKDTALVSLYQRERSDAANKKHRHAHSGAVHLVHCGCGYLSGDYAGESVHSQTH